MERKRCLLYFFCVQCLFFGILFFKAEIASALPSHRISPPVLETRGAEERVLIELTHPADTSWFSLESPDRVVVEIKDAYLPQVSLTRKINSPIIRTVRMGQNKKDVVRVVLDLNPGSIYEFSTAQGLVQNSHILSLSIGPPGNGAKPPKDTGTLLAAAPLTREKAPFEPEPEQPGPTTAPANTTGHFEGEEKKADEQTIILTDESMPEGIFEDIQEDQSEQKDWEISGLVQARATSQIKDNGSVENETGFRNRMILEAEYRDIFLISAFSDYLFFGRDDKTDTYDLTIREFTWQYNSPKIGLSVGKQIIRWGKTDQISPVDTLNPEDVREFILPEYEERKIPVWMADVRYYFDKFTLEGVFIPFFEESRQDYFQTDWAVFGHLKKEISNANLPPFYKSYFNNLSVHEQEPDNETEWGLRLTTAVKSVDLGITFHHTTEDSPYFKSFPIKNIDISGGLSTANLMSSLGSAVPMNEDIEVEYKKTNIAGIEFETIWGGFGIRGEAAWQENESFITSDLTSVRKPTFLYIIGADYTTAGNTYLNLQVAHRHVSDYDPAILYIEEDETSLLGEIRMDTVSDRFQACLRYTKPLDNDSSYLNPYLKITYITNLECRIGASLFSGDRDTGLGRYKDHDVYYLDISYRF